MTLRALVLTSLALVTMSCGKLRELPTDPDGGGAPDPSATFTRVQNEIFTPTCAKSACHDSTAQSGLVLSSGVAYSNTVNQPSVEIASLVRVKPAFVDESYLYRKVIGAATIVGDRMPQGQPMLSDAHLSLLRDWIRRGAPND